MSADRNTGWLPKDFEIKDLDAPRRMAQRVRTRVVVHRKRVRMAQGAGALAALALILGVAPLLWRSAKAPTQMAGSSDVGATFRSRSVGSYPLPPVGGSHDTQRLSQPDLDSATAHVPATAEMAGPSDVGATFRSRSLDSNPSPPKGGSHNVQGQSQESPAGPAGVDVAIEKAGQGVELAWAGNPSQEFVVYRCTTPKFDRCDVAGVVKGTRWVDSGKETAPVVFYRVEPKV